MENTQLKVNDIVKSKRNSKVPYVIKEIIGKDAKVINLVDMYSYTIPLDDLYKIF